MQSANTNDLIEPEGTNAGSAAATDEAGSADPQGDVVSGGQPDDAPKEPDTEDQPDLTGTAPAQDEREPGFAQAESGQDSGLME